MIDPDSVITLPIGSSFEDADLTLGALPETYPDRAVAQLTYTYNERIIGTAYLMVKDGVPMGDEEPESPEESIPAETVPATQANSPEKSEGSYTPANLGAIIKGLGILLIVGLAALAVGWIIYRRKKEAEDLARRREARRKRLMQYGDEEEFERLLAEKKAKNTRINHSQDEEED